MGLFKKSIIKGVIVARSPLVINLKPLKLKVKNKISYRDAQEIVAQEEKKKFKRGIFNLNKKKK